MELLNEYDINPLDEYLENLFHKEVEFTITYHEVLMIKTGIEWMVKSLIQAIEEGSLELRHMQNIVFVFTHI